MPPISTTPERSASGVKTSGDWMSLFLGAGTGSGLTSPSLYSNVTPTTGRNSDTMYDRPSYSSSSSSGYSSYAPSSSSSYGSRYYSSSTSSYLGSYGSAGSARYTSRYSSGISSSRRYDSRRNDTTASNRNKEDDKRNEANNAAAEEETENEEAEKKRPRHRATVLNGSVIRLNRNRQPVSDTSSEEDSSEEDDDENEATPARDPTPPREPAPPPPEDPLVVEERMLRAQLALSFTLTMTDEENIRQRLMEIKKQIMKKNQSEAEGQLLQKFEKESEELCEPTRAKEEEEKILINRSVAYCVLVSWQEYKALYLSNFSWFLASPAGIAWDTIKVAQ